MKRRLLYTIIILNILFTYVFTVNVSAAKNLGYVWPTPTVTYISQYFSSGHTAIDIAGPRGSNIVASKAGTINKKYTGCNNVHGLKNNVTCLAGGKCNPYNYYNGFCNEAVGNGIVIRHNDGTWTGYSHMDTIASELSEGTYVSQGQYLGTMGSSGQSAGFHLHFTLRHGTNSNYWSNTAVNPLNYMDTDDGGDVPLPTNASMSINKGNNSSYFIGENVTFYFSATNATGYTLGIDKDGVRIHTPEMGSLTSFARTFTEPGNYSAYATCYNSKGLLDSNRVYWTVDEKDYIPSKTIYYNNSVYALYNYSVSWTYAKSLCEKMGGHLATISSVEEQAKIANLLSNGSKSAYWLGGSDADSEGIWKWYDGTQFWQGNSSGYAVNNMYNNWAGGQPDDAGSNEDSLGIYPDGMWNDFPANYSGVGFILEVDPASKPVATAVYNKNTYMLFERNITWTEAKAYCEMLGGHLATITSQEEQNAINTLIDKGSKEIYYVGASDKDSEGNWSWVDGTQFWEGGASGSAVDRNYTNWGSSQPDDYNGVEDYLHVYKSTKKWNDLNNSYGNVGFICEIPFEESPNATAEYGGNTYLLYDKSLSWEDAKSYCENLGGHLAVVTSENENMLLTDWAFSNGSSTNYWLGATDKDSEGMWQWVTGESFNYSNWESTYSEPNGGTNENYLQLFGFPKTFKGKWNDTSNLNSLIYSFGFICEFEKESDTPIKTNVVSAVKSDNNYILNLKFTNESLIKAYTVDIYIAFVTEDNKMVAVKHQQLPINKASAANVNFSANTDKSVQKAKILVWDAENELNPLSVLEETLFEDAQYIWSEYTVELPEFVSPDYYDIEEKTQYRKQEKIIQTQDGNNELEGYILYNRTWTNGNYTNWSPWDPNYVEPTEDRAVKTEQRQNGSTLTGYKYSRWQCVSAYGGMSVGTVRHDQYTYGNHVVYQEIVLGYQLTPYGTASYNSSIPKYIGYSYNGMNIWYNQEAQYTPNYYTVYSYRDKIYTYHFYKWGEWSNWQDEGIVASENVTVENQTLYRYKLKR